MLVDTSFGCLPSLSASQPRRLPVFAHRPRRTPSTLLLDCVLGSADSISGTSITTQQCTNVFYIQSPRLQSNHPFALPLSVPSPLGHRRRTDRLKISLLETTIPSSSPLGSCDAHYSPEERPARPERPYPVALQRRRSWLREPRGGLLTGHRRLPEGLLETRRLLRSRRRNQWRGGP